MKKLFALVLAAVMVLGCVSALAESDPYASLGNYTMIVGHAQPEGNPRYISMESFAKDVAEKTHGHVTVEVFGNGQLGTEKEMLEQVVQGVTQGMRGGQFDFSPRLLMFTLPFLTNTRAEVTALLQSDLAKKVCAEAEETTGTVIINLCDAGGYRQFSNSKHPIKTPADLVGLKMRTNGMKTIDMTFQAMGATTTTIPYSDLYMGLKTGVADGQENPWVNVEGMKFYEVQKYITEIHYKVWIGPIVVNAAWFKKQPADVQKAILEGGRLATENNRKMIAEMETDLVKVLKDKGVEILAKPEDEPVWQEKAMGVWPQFYDKIGDISLLDTMMKSLGRTRPQ